ncbi:MAG: hypothetical protein IJP70_10410 [Bacteroidales bacterium]|nr:hypothetical protein [Bacteroidales bacterium]
MRILKLYGGSILIVLASVVLFLLFKVVDIDRGTYNIALIVCAVVIIIGVLLNIFGGKSADKIGGK